MIFEDKSILVTGGTGSMGKTLVRRALSGAVGAPRKVIVFSRDEAKQHDMRVEYLHLARSSDDPIYRNFMNVLEFRIGDVRDYVSVCSAVRTADIVINAAALKQVPTCEYFPAEAIDTNCGGARNIVRAIEENGYPVDTVIGISTDKACKPVSVMGMTKAVQERIFTSANITNRRTRFISVRYGNVLASRGSVIPLFHEQIRRGGPVTLTDPRMTRFLLTIEDAVDAVFAALHEAQAGEVYVPNAPSASVLDIARALIGGRSIEIATIGARPGDKIHEILVSEEEIHHCVRRGNYYAIRSMLPELLADAEPNALEREFSSADSVLPFEDTLRLLETHALLMEDGASRESELLR